MGVTANPVSWVTVDERDEVGFDSQFLAHYDGVYRLLFRIVGTREQAEDLAQETFLKLHRHRFPAGREHDVRSWLYRVATNLAYNALRSANRRERRHERALRDGSALPSPSPDPAAAAVRECERQAVRRVLATLSERQA
jgi:RNA polymerase sigma-70 factor (ECF subfamily)